MKEKIAKRKSLLSLLVLLMLPVTGLAQFTFTTNNGSITITRYTGPGGAVTIPSSTNGWPIISIGDDAFAGTGLTSVTIPESITSIGNVAFDDCSSLTSITIPNSVTNIGYNAFEGANVTSITIPTGLTIIGNSTFAYCTATNITIPNGVISIGSNAFAICEFLTSITIPNSVTNIGFAAFDDCSSLTSITIPNSVINIGGWAFANCTSLTSIYFLGNAPDVGSYVFLSDNIDLYAYYLPGTTGWGPWLDDLPTFDNLPAALWNPKVQTTDASFGVKTNQFGFKITTDADYYLVVVVEACTNLANPIWLPLQTIAFNAGGSSSYYFSDPQWTNYASRFYRLCPP